MHLYESYRWITFVSQISIKVSLRMLLTHEWKLYYVQMIGVKYRVSLQQQQQQHNFY